MTQSPLSMADVLREVARAIARVQLNGGDPDQPAVRWNGTEMEPQEFPVWQDYRDEATAVIAELDSHRERAAAPDETEVHDVNFSERRDRPNDDEFDRLEAEFAATPSAPTLKQWDAEKFCREQSDIMLSLNKHEYSAVLHLVEAAYTEGKRSTEK